MVLTNTGNLNHFEPLRICMRTEISSPTIATKIPEDPFIWIDYRSESDGDNFVDSTGNTFKCTNNIEFWTNGITNGSIFIDKSAINIDIFSFSFCFSGNTKYPLIFGDILDNGAWIEIKDSSYKFCNNSGVFFSNTFEKKFTFSFTKNNSKYRFFHNGSYSKDYNLDLVTPDNTKIQINSGDRLINLFMYNRILLDSEINDLYSIDFQTSKGLDHLGFRNNIQSFSMEI